MATPDSSILQITGRAAADTTTTDLSQWWR